MTLVPYTNTYTDTDGTIADSDDIVAEFDRLSVFIAAWADSYETIGVTNVQTYEVPFDELSYDIDPSNGFIQSLLIDAVVEDINFNFVAREDGDPYRVYVVLRFASKDTRYTVSGPAGSSSVFGVSQAEYLPSQASKDDKYAGTIIATYGTDALHLQVYADNDETDAVGSDDPLQGISI